MQSLNALSLFIVDLDTYDINETSHLPLIYDYTKLLQLHCYYSDCILLRYRLTASYHKN